MSVRFRIGPFTFGKSAFHQYIGAAGFYFSA